LLPPPPVFVVLLPALRPSGPDHNVIPHVKPAQAAFCKSVTKKADFLLLYFLHLTFFSVRFRHLRPLLWDRFRNTGGDKKTQTKKMTDPILILIGRFFSL